MAIIDKILGDPNEKVLKKLQKLVEGINNLEDKFKAFSDSQLVEQTEKFKAQIKNGKALDDILPEAFALVREASVRTTGQRHFDVQLMGGITLHRGHIAEMRTGEGKTLTATLPSYLNSLTGKGVHVVTPNDYLSRVGGGWVGPIYSKLGVSVGVITHDFAGIYDPNFTDSVDHGDERLNHWRPVERAQAYAADITYGTNNEFGFDYLRDNMAQTPKQQVQGDLHFAIVDEIDSILIDEARTPLIISAPDNRSSKRYDEFARLVKQLKENEDFNIDEKMRAATLTEDGIAKMEKWLGMDNIYTEGGITMVHHIEQALKAEALFKKDRDYVVKEGEIVIVDEFTGRLMPGRRYSEGLHQAIEAKEGVEVQRESMTLATVTFQNYFRLYDKLSGMTGTAATEAEEFAKIYDLEVTVIPTNQPMVRDDRVDKIYKNEKGKFQAIVEDIKLRQAEGQPVLIGTISIEKNELLGEYLKKTGLKHEMLNAKNHEREAMIIAQAGKPGAVTVATNMAGRGVDIILGGTPYDKAEYKKVVEAGGLHVIGTERHESRRIDNQLRGRSGRQGDSGSSQFFVSMDDDLMRIFGSDRMQRVMETLKVPEDMPIENKIISKSIEQAQKKVEGNNFDIRKRLVEYDDVLNKHREAIYRRRKEILSSGNVKERIQSMVENEITNVVSFHTAVEDEKQWDLKEVYEVATTIFPLDEKEKVQIKDLGTQAGDKKKDADARTKIITYLNDLAKTRYEELERYVNELIVDKENPLRNLEKQILLRAIDTLWIEHLDAMTALRIGIGLRGYGQKDPLVEYKKEAYRLYNELQNLIQRQVVYSIYKIGEGAHIAKTTVANKDVQLTAPAKTGDQGQQQFSDTGGAEAMAKEARRRVANTQQHTQQTKFEGQKVGRNDPCPCGATNDDGTPKKFKACHGKA